MKYIIYALYLSIISCSFSSCADNTTQIKTTFTYRGKSFNIIEVDSCEYIYINNWFSHKGNCKFCTQRKTK